MGKLKDKYNKWKIERTTKFFTQSDKSFQETRKEASQLSSAYFNEKALSEKFSYTFKKPSDQKSILIAKKINLISLIAFVSLLTFFVIFIGLLYFTNLFNTTDIPADKIPTLRYSAWTSCCLMPIIVISCFVIYSIPTLILTFIRNKKFKNNPNYVFRYSNNLIYNIISCLCLLFVFFTYVPFNFAPVYYLICLQWNDAGQKALLIITSIIGILCFISYLVYFVSTFMCHHFNPKFNIETLIEKDKQ